MSNEAFFQVSVKAIVRNNAGEVLLLQATPAIINAVVGRVGGHWDVPGGRVKVGEKLEQTLHREVSEEVGLDHFDAISFLVATMANVRLTLENGDEAGIVLFAYVCDLAAGSEIVLGDEHLGYKWCSVDEAVELLAPNYPDLFIAELAKLDSSK